MKVVQSIDYVAVGPPLVVAIGALALLVLDLLLPRPYRWLLGWIPIAVVLIGILSLVPLKGHVRGTFCLYGTGPPASSCSYVVDGLTVALQAAVLLGAAVVVLMSQQAVLEDRMPPGEYYFLLLSSVSGALTLAAARDLLTVIVALEVVSLPAFALVALRRDDRRAGEAALKVFLMSVTATAVSLFGISLVYGVTGQVQLGRLSTALADPKLDQPVTHLAVVLTLAAFAFKVAAVPFHAWAPDTYAGSSVPVAAYLSVVSKTAGFAGLILVATRGFASYSSTWSPVLAAVAALTMTVGNLVALRQDHAVRLLAWSSIAQAGYVLVPLGVLGATTNVLRTAQAVQAVVVYVLAYVVMNLGAFCVVAVVGRSRPAQRLQDYRGLARADPLPAIALTFFLACLAGLPPGLIGLFAKIRVFEVPVRGGLAWLAVAMAVNTVIGLYYYLSWAALLFASPEGEPRGVQVAPAPPGLRVALGLTLVAAVGLSLAPSLVIDAAPPGNESGNVAAVP